MTGDIPRLAVGRLLSESWRTICRIYRCLLVVPPELCGKDNIQDKTRADKTRADKTRQAKAKQARAIFEAQPMMSQGRLSPPPTTTFYS